MQPPTPKVQMYWIKQEFPRKEYIRQLIETEKQAIYKTTPTMRVTFPNMCTVIAKIPESEYKDRTFFWRLAKDGVYYIQRVAGRGSKGRHILERIKVENNGDKRKIKQYLMRQNDVWDLVRTDCV